MDASGSRSRSIEDSWDERIVGRDWNRTWDDENTQQIWQVRNQIRNQIENQDQDKIQVLYCKVGNENFNNGNLIGNQQW